MNETNETNETENTSSDINSADNASSAFEAPSASDAYEKASTAATTPINSAFEMNSTSSAASTTPANDYSTTSNTSDSNNTASTNTNSTTGYNSDFYTATGSSDTIETPKGFAIVSLIMGIGGILTSCCCGIGSIFCILGIIFGCIQEKDPYGNKPGQATAGIITSCVGLALSVPAILFFLVFGVRDYM